MINRRQILSVGLAAGAMPIVASLPVVAAAKEALNRRAAKSAAVLAHPALYRVLFDQRFAAARAFGEEARWNGHSVVGFNGDITNVWFNDLRPRWKLGPAAIAGYTAHGALFCLERLAWDVGMRVVESVEVGDELYSWVISAPLLRGPQSPGG